MRLSWAAAILFAGISAGSVAQQTTTFKVKKSPPEKAPASIPMVKIPVAKPSSSNSKDLQAIEHSTAKSSEPTHSADKKVGTTAALKPEKDKPTPPINFAGSGPTKKGPLPAGPVTQSSNPYSGRLRHP